MTQQKKQKTISGFSKLSKSGKIRWIIENFFKDPEAVARELRSFWHGDEAQQRILDGFSENTISNFPMPYGVAPNFLINGQTYCVPMVIEESSVVAAAAAAAKFWMERGGFKATVLSTRKIGQVHFFWKGDFKKLQTCFAALETHLRNAVSDITRNMEKRGGGLREMELLDLTHLDDNYYQLKAGFETCDSMGANFINSVLEIFGRELQSFVQTHPAMSDTERDLSIIMAILSNYTPECLVRTEVSCPVENLEPCGEELSAADFAQKFYTAVKIAQIDTHRATTHNKGIFNGIDAVVLATGNDFRAVEACGHTYASRDGQYRSLTTCTIEDDTFRFWLDIPLALGTVGGLTKLHPLAKRSLELLNQPNAETLMCIIASVGLAQNFAAIKSLITTGIQKGHMKMHLINILNHLEASENEITATMEYFSDKIVSFTAVREYLQSYRTDQKLPCS